MTAAVPDPRFRDTLEDLLVQSVGAQMPRGKVWRPGKVLDALMPAIAAEVEARVQAAAGQQAAEELLRLRADLAADEDAPTDAALEGLDFTLRALATRAAALPAPRPGATS